MPRLERNAREEELGVALETLRVKEEELSTEQIVYAELLQRVNAYTEGVRALKRENVSLQARLDATQYQDQDWARRCVELEQTLKDFRKERKSTAQIMQDMQREISD